MYIYMYIYIYIYIYILKGYCFARKSGERKKGKVLLKGCVLVQGSRASVKRKLRVRDPASEGRRALKRAKSC